jgi:hypothetical protein
MRYKKHGRSNVLVCLEFALVLLLGTALVWSLRGFPPAQTHLGLWRILVMSLTTMALRAVWSRRK